MRENNTTTGNRNMSIHNTIISVTEFLWLYLNGYD